MSNISTISTVASTDAPHRLEQMQLPQLRTLGTRLRYAALLASVIAANAMAQGGGTGTGDAVQARLTSVTSTFQVIMYGIAGALFGAAGIYATIGIATGMKKWSDLGTVCGAMIAGGLISAAIAWFWN